MRRSYSPEPIGSDENPVLRPIKNGWAALGGNWAVHGKTEAEAREQFAQAVERHREIDARVAAAQALPDLLPCPFCGEFAAVTMTQGQYWAECLGCHISPRDGEQTPEAAAALWNRRTPDGAPAPGGDGGAERE
jgi:hypothetical protein